MHTELPHLPNVIKKRDKKDLPDEDSILAKDGIFAVADGVTTAFKDSYPTPSPAAMAAETFTKSVVAAIKDRKNDGFGALIDAFSKANKDVALLNEQLGITASNLDHLEYQQAACLAAYGFTDHGVMYFAQLNVVAL